MAAGSSWRTHRVWLRARAAARHSTGYARTPDATQAAYSRSNGGVSSKIETARATKYGLFSGISGTRWRLEPGQPAGNAFACVKTSTGPPNCWRTRPVSSVSSVVRSPATRRTRLPDDSDTFMTLLPAAAMVTPGGGLKQPAVGRGASGSGGRLAEETLHLAIDATAEATQGS